MGYRRRRGSAWKYRPMVNKQTRSDVGLVRFLEARGMSAYDVIVPSRHLGLRVGCLGTRRFTVLTVKQ